MKLVLALSGFVSGYAPVLRDIGRQRRKQEPCHGDARRRPHAGRRFCLGKIRRGVQAVSGLRKRRRLPLTIFVSRRLPEIDSPPTRRACAGRVFEKRFFFVISGNRRGTLTYFEVDFRQVKTRRRMATRREERACLYHLTVAT